MHPNTANFSLKKKTKVIATYGPSCSSVEEVKKLILEGVDVFRINSSHMNDPQKLESITKIIREAARNCKKFIGIMLDLQGPKIRLGDIQDNSVSLRLHQEFTLTTENILGDQKKASVSYQNLHNEVNVGEIIFIDDGKVQLEIKKIEEKNIICNVKRSGKLSNKKGVNLPFSSLKISALTEKDFLYAEYAIKTGCDFVAISFISDESDIENLKKFLKQKNGEYIQVISKIERQQAIDNLDNIIQASDAIMVARGDLGVEVGIENVPKYQKLIIQKSNYYIKPVIVATQMLESMIQNQIATRAEASDIANAVYDECDAVMLSGETAVGIAPLAAVKTMVTICNATENHVEDLKKEVKIIQKSLFYAADTPTILCKAAYRIADETQSDYIVSFTSSGNTPKICSKLRPSVFIISPTDNIHICRYMCLFRGVIPLLIKRNFSDISRWRDMIKEMIVEAKANKLIEKDQKLVVLAGIPIGESGGLNSIRLVNVKE